MKSSFSLSYIFDITPSSHSGLFAGNQLHIFPLADRVNPNAKATGSRWIQHPNTKKTHALPHLPCSLSRPSCKHSQFARSGWMLRANGIITST